MKRTLISRRDCYTLGRKWMRDSTDRDCAKRHMRHRRSDSASILRSEVLRALTYGSQNDLFRVWIRAKYGSRWEHRTVSFASYRMQDGTLCIRIGCRYFYGRAARELVKWAVGLR